MTGYFQRVTEEQEDAAKCAEDECFVNDRLRAELSALRAERDALLPWRTLYRRAVNEANGLTNYVEDRPELRHAEKRLTAIEAEARAIDAARAALKGE